MWRRMIVIKIQTILSVVLFLGSISAALGLSAMCTNIRVYQVHQVSPGVCSYPRTPAHVLGMTSALVLLLAHIIVNIVNVIVNSTGGCIICCGRNRYISTTCSTLALVCFIVSWFTFVVAFFLLFGGAVLIDQRERQVQLGHKHCYILNSGVFGAGSVLSITSVAFSIFYSLIITAYALDSSFGDPALPNEGGVAMVPAQVLPPTSHDPV